jgi:hypothetical protein
MEPEDSLALHNSLPEVLILIPLNQVRTLLPYFF